VGDDVSRHLYAFLHTKNRDDEAKPGKRHDARERGLIASHEIARRHCVFAISAPRELVQNRLTDCSVDCEAHTLFSPPQKKTADFVPISQSHVSQFSPPPRHSVDNNQKQKPERAAMKEGERKR
jgi:hypothetical protein